MSVIENNEIKKSMGGKTISFSLSSVSEERTEYFDMVRQVTTVISMLV